MSPVSSRHLISALAVFAMTAGLDAQRRSPQRIKLEKQLSDLQRRRDVAEQTIRDLLRRRVAHDLRVPMSLDEVVRGLPKGDPMRKAILEKELAAELDAVRDAGARLDAIRVRALEAGERLDDIAAVGDKRVPDSTPIAPPAAPGGPGVDLSKATPERAKEGIAAEETRFFQVPWAGAGTARDHLAPDLPFAFDEVARSVPNRISIRRTVPTRDLGRRAWALVHAGMYRRAIAVIAESYPETSERPFDLRFLEARAFEELGEHAEARAIYSDIASKDRVVKAGAGGAQAAPADGEEAAGESAEEVEPGPWARASEVALAVLEFSIRHEKTALPSVEDIRW